jgi:hypothetical protein
MKNFTSLLIAAVLLAACQKEIHGDIVPGGTTSNSDYQPVTANSEWNYHSTTAGDYMVRSIGEDTMINGTKYYKFDNINNGTAVRFYVSKTNGIYHNYGFFPQAAQQIDLVLLKDSAVGTTWTNELPAGAVSSYHKYTIAAKGQQRTVNGKAFSNVIEVNYEMSIDNPLGGGTIQAGTGKNYWAKGVGVIESFYNIGFFGINTSDTTRLVTYTIH